MHTRTSRQQEFEGPICIVILLLLFLLLLLLFIFVPCHCIAASGKAAAS
jgi:hypothetical protein